MTKSQNQTLIRITQILQKMPHERQFEQLHFLTLTLKKSANTMTDITDWWMQSRCIQNLQLWTTKKNPVFSTDLKNQNNQRKSQSKIKQSTLIRNPEQLNQEQQKYNTADIDWILVLKGSFIFHGMKFQEGEYFNFLQDSGSAVKLANQSTFAVLTKSIKNKIRGQAQQRLMAQKKIFARKVIFQDATILNKDLTFFWEFTKLLTIKKNEKLQLSKMDDTIFVVLQGSLNLNYQWKRLIKLRQLGTGSIFSTFLGRYFHKTGEQWKTMQKYQFQAFGKSQCLILSFSPDIFYEQQKLQPYKLVVNKAWKLYQSRVAELKRIIQQVGLMRPEKQQVIKNIQQEIEKKYLREKCVSVPIAIEKRKLRKIAYSIFQEKMTRRKIPNLLHTKSTNAIEQLTIQSKQVVQSRQKSPKTQRPKIERQHKTVGIKLDLRPIFQRSKTQSIIKNASVQRQGLYQNKSSRSFSKSRPSRGMTIRTQTSLESQRNQENQQGSQTFYRFFRPEQFISKKLRNHYQSVLMGMQQIHLPLQQTIESDQTKKMKNSKNKKQYFEEYVNQRRIVKLGPKKRLLYKHKRGF